MNITRIAILVAIASLAPSNLRAQHNPPPIRVVIWDERQPEQKQAYNDGFLGDHIAAELAKQPGIRVKSVGQDDPDLGLSKETLDDCDVLIWWSHVRHGQVPDGLARDIVRRVRDGKLALVPIHSALSSKPFQMAMRLRTLLDATAVVADLEGTPTGIDVRIDYPSPDAIRAKTMPPTPTIEPIALDIMNRITIKVLMPAVAISAFREDSKPSHTTVLAPHHPIAAGLPARFDIPHTEMYDEPFHVPEPDVVIFQEDWDAGETFRSGCLWRLGKGYVFYYRPGHETDAVYTNAEPMKVLENAVRYLAAEKRMIQTTE